MQSTTSPVISNQNPTDHTISDDQSVREKVEERRLFALREPRQGGHALTYPWQGDNSRRDQLGWNYALRDYHLPLMLLEQSIRNRLHLSRPDQERSMSTFEHDEQEGTLSMDELTPNDSPEEDYLSRTNAETHHNANPRKRDASELELLSLLDKDVSQMSVGYLQDCLRGLQKRAKHLMAAPEEAAKPALRYQIFYRLLHRTTSNKTGIPTESLSSPFFDPPEPFRGQGGAQALRCKVPVENIDLYLERNKDISFIVYLTYKMNPPDHNASDDVSQSRPPRYQRSHLVEESIRPISKALIQGLEVILTSHDRYANLLQLFGMTFELHSPYLFMYHNRKDLGRFTSVLGLEARDHFTLFSNYVSQRHGDVYGKVDSTMSRGMISSAYIDYLFKPGDVLVERTEDDYRGWVASSWLMKTETTRAKRAIAEARRASASEPSASSLDQAQRAGNDIVCVQHCNIEAWAWEFDVNFQRNQDVLTFTVKSEYKSGNLGHCTYGETHLPDGDNQATEYEVPISELNVFPLDFAANDIVERLRLRGQTFWRCRERSFVSYRNDRNSAQGVEKDRYMIDLRTYYRLHPRTQARELNDDLGPAVFAQDHPPEGPFVLLLPLRIKGYNVRVKKWHDLKVDHISDVQWNKEAFQKVVIERKAKDLIRALVSNQIAMEHSTDLIEGKGNGLILLLHGSPGTGKTMMAESVAEIAEKPLYRVTCGDVGTNAQHVEKYLESVFHLGKLWGCVVLLDEADVFLEQRSLEDLQRNALVSVFLRMLEYYEGILILTSNRVGIFDEAFKSRIQLALHFPNLGSYQRIRIWENFIDRLAKFDDGFVDIADLRDNLEKLGEEKMNGRQIRNVMTTARQYAMWKKVTLTYEHLRDVIDVSGRFDKYLDRLNGGLTQDQIAEDEGVR